MSDEQDFEGIGEEVEENLEEVQQEPQDEPKDDDVDPRYRGKSLKEIIDMHRNAEMKISTQGQELGEIRKLADELIKSQLHPKKEDREEVDFLDNPEEAVRRAIEANPDLKKAKEEVAVVRQNLAKQELLKKHPDAYDLVQNPEFLDWIKGSKVRTQLALQADQNFDVDAADELYSTFKAIQGTKAKPDADKAVREKAIKAASADVGGSGESSKKIYRRADLIQLRITKPQEFYARQAEFDQAYLEGRVR